MTGPLRQEDPRLGHARELLLDGDQLRLRDARGERIDDEDERLHAYQLA